MYGLKDLIGKVRKATEHTVSKQKSKYLGLKTQSLRPPILPKIQSHVDFSNFDEFPTEVEEEIPEEVNISHDEGYSSNSLESSTNCAKNSNPTPRSISTQALPMSSSQSSLSNSTVPLVSQSSSTSNSSLPVTSTENSTSNKSTESVLQVSFHSLLNGTLVVLF